MLPFGGGGYIDLPHDRIQLVCCLLRFVQCTQLAFHLAYFCIEVAQKNLPHTLNLKYCIASLKSVWYITYDNNKPNPLQKENAFETKKQKIGS